MLWTCILILLCATGHGSAKYSRREAVDEVPGQLHRGDAPSLVLVETYDFPLHGSPSGVIVDPGLILMAPQYTEGAWVTAVYVTAGSVNFDIPTGEEQQRIVILDASSVAPVGANDSLYVLELKPPLEVTDVVQVVRLSDGDAVSNCSQCLLAGWGERPEEPGYKSGFAMGSEVTEVAPSNCGMTDNEENYLCFHSVSGEPCQLNYDGPVVCRCGEKDNTLLAYATPDSCHGDGYYIKAIAIFPIVSDILPVKLAFGSTEQQAQIGSDLYASVASEFTEQGYGLESSRL
ncbi:hypothetical protein BaRGS_00024173 [Batillaria attramentaria]|uniref:Peptidase S1 domain-containing protein n=1 Tax=Batillaria attramentaria TaxID=370345 RepID=A0ABD0KBN2_9CAEN